MDEVEQRLRDKYDRELLTMNEVQAELGVSRTTLTRMRKKGDIVSVSISGTVKFSIKAVANVITGG